MILHIELQPRPVIQKYSNSIAQHCDGWLHFLYEEHTQCTIPHNWPRCRLHASIRPVQSRFGETCWLLPPCRTESSMLLHMNMYMYVCKDADMHVEVTIYVWVSISACMHVCVAWHVSMHACMHVCIYACN